MEVKLVMFKPDGQRKDIPVNLSDAVIGRGEDCMLRIPLAAVSRRHCELSIEDDELKVKDLASSNGTYVNNDKVNEAVLSAGDRLVVGGVTFTVQIDGQPEEIAPTTDSDESQERPEAPAAVAASAGQDDDDEEVVDLEADIFGELTRNDDEEDDEDPFAALGAGGEAEETSDSEELDPIAALEALASEKDDEDEQK